MVAWPGEKLALDDVVVVAGGLDPYAGVLFPLQFTESPDSTVTLSAGDDVILYSKLAQLLVPGDPVGACNWIIEATAGGAVEVSTSRDPGWTYASDLEWAPAASSIATGRTLIPLPAADRAFEWLHGDMGGLLLRLTVTAGTVTLSSVRLQLEPPGGLLVRTGWEWSDYVTPGPVWMPGDVGAGFAGAALSVPGSLDRDAALDQIRSGAGNVSPINAPDGTPSNSYMRSGRLDGGGAGGTTSSQDRVLSLAITQPVTDVWLQVGYSFAFWKERPDYRELPDLFTAGGLVAGRDFEKTGTGSTWSSYGEFAAGDTLALEWGPVKTQATYNPSPGFDETFGATLSLAAGLLLADTDGAWTGRFSGWPPPLAGGASAHVTPEQSGSVVDLGTPPAGSDFTVTVRGDLADAGHYPTTGDPGDTSFHQWAIRPTVQIRYQMPDFRYRVPVFAPDPDALARKPRFYVTFSEVDDDPRDVSHVVGIGKPADDASIFRVPTPLGTLRELRHGEKVSDVSVAYPLKVKLYDGSWTTVAAMTPDT